MLQARRRKHSTREGWTDGRRSSGGEEQHEKSGRGEESSLATVEVETQDMQPNPSLISDTLSLSDFPYIQTYLGADGSWYNYQVPQSFSAQQYPAAVATTATLPSDISMLPQDYVLMSSSPYLPYYCDQSFIAPDGSGLVYPVFAYPAGGWGPVLPMGFTYAGTYQGPVPDCPDCPDSTTAGQVVTTQETDKVGDVTTDPAVSYQEECTKMKSVDGGGAGLHRSQTVDYNRSHYKQFYGDTGQPSTLSRQYPVSGAGRGWGRGGGRWDDYRTSSKYRMDNSGNWVSGNGYKKNYVKKKKIVVKKEVGVKTDERSKDGVKEETGPQPDLLQGPMERLDIV